MNKDLEIGEVVKLSPTTGWSTSDVMNPLNIKGIVVSQDKGWTGVDWSNTENGLTNMYKSNEEDLIIVEDIEEIQALSTLLSFAKEDVAEGRVMSSERFKKGLARRKEMLK